MNPYNLSESYWAALSDSHKSLYALVRPLAEATYEVEVRLDHVESFLAEISRDMQGQGGNLELDPDFQRGHVWDDGQRVAYIEALLRGVAPRRLLFNCPSWSRRSRHAGDIPAASFQCIDGLQRLTTVRRFMAGELTVFGEQSAASLRGSPFDPGRYRLSMAVFEFAQRADLLQFYLDLNSGGTVHTGEELARVRQLRDASTVRADN